MLKNRIANIADNRINDKLPQTDYGEIISYNEQNHTATVNINGKTLSGIPVIANYKPLVGDPVNIITRYGEMRIEPTYNANYSQNEDEYQQNNINNTLYRVFGNYVSNGINKNSMMSDYDETNTRFVVFEGEMNIEGNVVQNNTTIYLEQDFSILSDGEYLLVINELLELLLNPRETELLVNEIPLLKVILQTDATTNEQTYELIDFRPTTNLIQKL